MTESCRFNLSAPASHAFMTVEVTGKRYSEVGLVVPGKYHCYTKHERIGKVLHDELKKKKNIYPHFNIDIFDNYAKFPHCEKFN